MSHEKFRNAVHNARENLNELAHFWSNLIDDENTVPEDVCGRIMSAVGKTRLLVSEKFKQFEGLIDQSERKTAEKDISLNDLEGYWDLVSIQVNEVKDTYRMLEVLREKAWTTDKQKNRQVESLEQAATDFSASIVANVEQLEAKCLKEKEKVKQGLEEAKARLREISLEKTLELACEEQQLHRTGNQEQEMNETNNQEQQQCIQINSKRRITTKSD